LNAYGVGVGTREKIEAGIEAQDTDWARKYRKQFAVGKGSLLTGSEQGVDPKIASKSLLK